MLEGRMLRNISRQESCCQAPVQLQKGQALTNTRTPSIIRWALLSLIETF